jgi:hypothetical protein
MNNSILKIVPYRVGRTKDDNYIFLFLGCGMRQRSWLRHYAKNGKVGG